MPRQDKTGKRRPDKRNDGAGRYHCFGASTLIDTPTGARPVEALQIGDLVDTLDHGPQPVVWIWNGRQPLRQKAREQRPVLIQAGALGQGRPSRDLILSPQHGVLVGEETQYDQRFDAPALAAAQILTPEIGVRFMMGRKAIHWFNFACERHEVIRANGVLAETLLITRQELSFMPARDRRALTAIFTDTQGDYLNGPPARPFPGAVSETPQQAA